jgi:pyruvate/2-oxoglutarate dehydrogenase complex dihydrolipoamide acyltransferase (E2) component
MAYEFKLPDIGEGMAEGEIVRWLVKEGDLLAQDQPMVEVMTDKATVEIATPHAGRVLERRFKEGERCPVGEVLIVIECRSKPTRRRRSTWRKTPGPAADGASGGILATPATRSLAREMSVDLSKVKGSGPGGQITIADVRSAKTGGRRSENDARQPAHAGGPNTGKSATFASRSAACAA